MNIKAKGLSGQIEVSKEAVMIKRRGFSSIFRHLRIFKEKEFSYDEISSVYLKPAGTNNGLIRFSKNGSAKPRLGVLTAAFDNNTVTFHKSANEQFRKIIEELSSKNVETSVKDQTLSGEINQKVKDKGRKSKNKLESYSQSLQSEDKNSQVNRPEGLSNRDIEANSMKSKVILTDNILRIEKNKIISENHEIKIENLSEVKIDAKSRGDETLISVNFQKKSSGVSSLIRKNKIRTIWESESDYSPIIDALKNEGVKISEDISELRNREIKRTCNECRNIWHVQEDEIQELKKTKKNNKIVGGLTALSGQLATSAQANRNKDAVEEQLKELERCPECRSKNYEEEIVEYDKE